MKDIDNKIMLMLKRSSKYMKLHLEGVGNAFDYAKKYYDMAYKTYLENIKEVDIKTESMIFHLSSNYYTKKTYGSNCKADLKCYGDGKADNPYFE